MRKATSQKSAPVSLGTKRACTKCGTKFYDFGKAELSCPKCQHKFTVEELANHKFVFEPKRKPAKAPSTASIEDEETTVAGGDGFESLEDLSGEDDDGVEDVDVEDDDDEEEKY